MHEVNQFIKDQNHYGPITIRQAVQMVTQCAEFPDGLDTKLCFGDVEGNNGVMRQFFIGYHKSGDIVLYTDLNEGDMNYD